MRAEVDVLGSPLLNSPYCFCGRKAQHEEYTHTQTERERERERKRERERERERTNFMRQRTIFFYVRERENERIFFNERERELCESRRGCPGLSAYPNSPYCLYRRKATSDEEEHTHTHTCRGERPTPRHKICL